MRRPNALILFRMGAAILVLAALMIGGSALLSAQRQRTVADDSMVQLRRFAIAFQAFNALSAERGPSEAALAALTDDPRQRQRLILARGASDWAIERLRDASGDTISFNFDFLIAKIRNDRARLDGLLAEPPAERRLGETLSVVRELIAIGETAEPIVSKLGRAVIRSDPRIAGDVNLVRLLTSLEQSARRLPSEVLPTLAERQVLRTDLLAAALRTQQRILALWDLGSTQLVVSPSEHEMTRQLELVRAEYMGRGLPYLSRLIERQSQRPNPTLDAREVRMIYEATVEPITKLRSLLMERIMQDAEARQAHAFEAIVTAAALCSVLMGTLVALIVFAYREVFRPLLAFRSQIMAISDREPVPAAPYRGDVPQLQALSRAIETLRRRDGEREALERDRLVLSERLVLLASTDELTGLLNRRGFYEALAALPPGLARAFVLIDIDHFKLINDRYGHAVGDLVLCHVGAWLRDGTNTDVIAARYGGEEFALVLTGNAASEVLGRMETLRAAIEAREIETEDEASLRLTASFGVAIDGASGESWEEMARLADLALYEAKRDGRNRVRATNPILARRPVALAPAQAEAALAV